jgi:beta-mannosidase
MLGIQYAVEHWRRNMPRCMGALYWQLNDCWPVASWSSIDSNHRWKALQFGARRFFAPILLSALEDGDKHTIELYLASDERKTRRGEITWTLVTPEGQILTRDVDQVQVAPNKASRALRLELADVVAEHGAENLMCFADLDIDGRIVSSTYSAFTKPKGIYLQDPQYTTKLRKGDGDTWLLTVKANRPALFCWLELKGIDADLSDNFFHLYPGVESVVLISPEKKLTKDQLTKKLRIRSIVDTY